jgi:TonB-dependent SusC/RagA subfamily outer membrane receptor
MKWLLSVLFHFVFFSPGNAQTKIVCPAPALSHYGTDPLLIIDTNTVAFSNFRYLSPQSIEDITILKDVKATALYGSKAAYGVVIVATKKKFRFFDMEEILRAYDADSVIGKPMIVTVNSNMVSDIKALKIDASIIHTVQIFPIVNINDKSSYDVAIQLRPINAGGPKADTGTSRQIMIRGDKTGLSPF